MNAEKNLFELPPAELKPDGKEFRERNPIWTECKAKLIERYLFYFVQITHTGTYIDAFAGPQESEKHEMWSAKLVIESCPRWIKNFFLFELKPSQVKFIEVMIALKLNASRHIPLSHRTVNQFHSATRRLNPHLQKQFLYHLRSKD